MDLDQIFIEESISDEGWRASRADEVNHRIANNLQLVSGYLSLQERDVTDLSAKSALKEAASRLAAVGQVHRALLRGRTATVELGTLLTAVCAGAGEATGLTVNVTTDAAPLPPDVAQALAIVVNELILNAAKHAYDGRGGEVDVSCRRSPGCTLTVTVSDKGPGLPETDTIARSSGVGMTIIRSEVRRLEGWITFHSASGTHATLTIPLQAGEDSATKEKSIF